MTFFKTFFETLNNEINKISEENLNDIVSLINETSSNGKKVIIVGNGGSAAMASHVSVDLTKNAGIRCINFNEADLLTCFANDYGYENWVSKAIEFYSDPGDLVILISSSGSSKNMINGSKTAKKLGLKLVTLSGFNPENNLRKLGDINLYVDSKGYNIVEMAHHVWLLAIVDKIIGKIVY
tara:strand:+ start:2406 stop:2948 length:543 start_codon:yes stop_codon:yes gene_type:complete